MQSLSLPKFHLFSSSHSSAICPRLTITNNSSVFAIREVPKATVQRLAKVGAPGLVNLIADVAYHFCPSLPAAFTQPGAATLADLCNTPPYRPLYDDANIFTTAAADSERQSQPAIVKKEGQKECFLRAARSLVAKIVSHRNLARLEFEAI